MSFTHGMNTDEVERLGQDLQRIAGDLEQLRSTLDTRVRDTTWVGPDADMFKNNWWPGHRDTLRKIQEDLHGFGQSALNNASAQREASSR